MSQAENLLASLNETVSEHEHAVIDSNSYFVIDSDTRKIENAAHRKNVLMQYDHNSERYTFETARYIEGHDMSLCNRVRVHYINIDGQTEETHADFVELDDVRVDENNPDHVICSWLISRHATQFVGNLSFLVQYMCVSDIGTVDCEWHSDIYDDVEIKAGLNNGELAIIEYTDIIEQWRTKLFGSGNSVVAEITLNAETQLKNIEDEGAEQVASVKAEGKTQVDAVKEAGNDKLAAIQLKAEEALASIPEDYTSVSNMAKEAIRTKADAIICEAKGESIVLKDSSNDYICDLKLFGKSSQVITNGYQLFDASEIATRIAGGATITNNEDGSFTVSGSSKLTANINTIKDYTHEETIAMLKAGTLSLNRNGPLTYPYWYLQLRSNNVVLVSLGNSSNESSSVNITQTMLDSDDTYLRIGFYGSSGSEIVPGEIKPMLYQDGEGVWEPYTGGKPSPSPEYPQEIVNIENPIVRACGKNYLENLFESGYTETYRGVTFTFGPDRSITVSGTPTASIAYDISKNVFMQAGKYYLSGAPKTGSAKFRLQVNPIVDGKEITGTVDGGNGGLLTLATDSLVRSYIYVAFDAGEVSGTFYPQLEKGSAATEYEPYSGNRIDIKHTLYGIPVSSGGNYTDVNGQQWICDEVDLERGVHIRNINTIAITGDEIIANVSGDYAIPINKAAPDNPYSEQCLCNYYPAKGRTEIGQLVKLENQIGVSANLGYIRFADTLQFPEIDIQAFAGFLKEKYTAGNPVTVSYVLAKPIETPLTAEEIVAFKALRTNYPNTTILNDAGTWMSVKYNADIKKYVENPKILKLVDSSTGVVYELKIVDGNLTVVQV